MSHCIWQEKWRADDFNVAYFWLKNRNEIRASSLFFIICLIRMLRYFYYSDDASHYVAYLFSTDRDDFF